MLISVCDVCLYVRICVFLKQPLRFFFRLCTYACVCVCVGVVWCGVVLCGVVWCGVVCVCVFVCGQGWVRARVCLCVWTGLGACMRGCVGVCLWCCGVWSFVVDRVGA